MGEDAQKVFRKSRWWMRLSVCVNVHIKNALLDVLHNRVGDNQINGLTSDPQQLFSFFVKYQHEINNQKGPKLKKEQLEYLFPHNKRVETSQMDVTLVQFLIRKFCHINNAKGNWDAPDNTDNTIAANVHRAVGIRNQIFHCSNIRSETEFEDIWKRIKDILAGLHYQIDIEPMRTADLDYVRVEKMMMEGRYY